MSTTNYNIPLHNYKDDKSTCLPAIIDIKTLRVDKNNVMYKPGVHGGGTIKKAVEKKSDKVRTDYHTRIGKLDTIFAPDG